MKNIILKNEKYILKTDNDLVINITGKVIIEDINNNIKNMTINLDEKSSLAYYKFNKVKSDINIIINSQTRSNLLFRYSFISEDSYNLDILNNIKGHNIDNKIYVRGVTEKKGIANIKANADILSNTKENKYLEDIKILKLNDLISAIKPYLCVSSNDIIATHNATCSGISKSKLLYLRSKGISLNKAKKLIRNGFLTEKQEIDITNYL